METERANASMSHMSARWKNVYRLLFSAFALLSSCLPARTQSRTISPEDVKALGEATRGLCNVQVAMLGESATHGDGHTLAFKVALVERLVDQCGFNAVFFEANQDEFIHLNQRLRTGEAATSEDLLSAVGGLWKFYHEFQPLAPFLLMRAQAGKLSIGGLDDQLGQLGQDYANLGMITELTVLLPQAERQGCSTALHKRIYSDYSETAPYSKMDHSQIDTCLSAIHTATDTETTSTAEFKQEQQEMISSVQRWIGRDFSSDDESKVNRDRSMFQTFKWMESRLPKKRKVIVWAATVHIAKQGDPTWGDRAGTNLGSFVHREYGEHARSVGFSALSGSFRQGKGKFLAIPSAPAGSIEGRALQGTDTRYVNGPQLAALGKSPGAFFYHSYQTLAWSDFLNGVVVFRIEHPPADTR
jgi:erythromycin esterase-like protein